MVCLRKRAVGCVRAHDLITHSILRSFSFRTVIYVIATFGLDFISNPILGNFLSINYIHEESFGGCSTKQLHDFFFRHGIIILSDLSRKKFRVGLFLRMSYIPTFCHIWFWRLLKISSINEIKMNRPMVRILSPVNLLDFRILSVMVWPKSHQNLGWIYV